MTAATLTLICLFQINNAGVFCVPYAKTSEGFVQQLATNHLGLLLSLLSDAVGDSGHFLLPVLRASAPSRVVMVVAASERWLPAFITNRCCSVGSVKDFTPSTKVLNPTPDNYREMP